MYKNVKENFAYWLVIKFFYVVTYTNTHKKSHNSTKKHMLKFGETEIGVLKIPQNYNTIALHKEKRPNPHA